MPDQDQLERKQILEKAIKKAIDGGWVGMELDTPSHFHQYIFNHDFAKSLWGAGIAQFQEGVSGDTIHLNNIENWKGHLANMVVAEDPIKYLGENI